MLTVSIDQVADYLADLPQDYESAAGPDTWKERFLEYLSEQKSTSALDEWYALRLQESVLKATIAGVAVKATEEAVERVAGEEKKTFPIGPRNHKIQVRFTAKKIKHSDDQELDNLHAEIELEKSAATVANSDAIAQIEKDLVSLNRRLEELKLTDRGRALERQYNERLDELAEMVPVLALKGL